ncbi:MAG: hypothetical protein ABIO04_02150 [Ferruginibacter sp.]
MNKRILLFVTAFCISITTIYAQQNMQRLTPEERTKAAIEKMLPLKLTEEAKTKTQLILSDFYNAQQTAMKELRAAGNVNKDVLQAKRKEMADKRDADLKVVLTEEQYQQWLTDIEPSLRPQRAKN